MADDPRADLVQRIEAIRERWRRLVVDVGEERMELPGAMGDWSFMDVASHLTAWRRKAVARLEAAGRGEPPPPAPWPAELGEDDTDDETDAINAWIYEQEKDRPLSEVLAETDAIYEPLIAALRALPIDAAVRERASYVDAEAEDGHPYGHLGEHERDVRRWLASAPARKR